MEEQFEQQQVAGGKVLGDVVGVLSEGMSEGGAEGGESAGADAASRRRMSLMTGASKDNQPDAGCAAWLMVQSRTTKPESRRSVLAPSWS